MRTVIRNPARGLLVAGLAMAAGIGVAGVGASWDHVTSVEDNRFVGTVADPVGRESPLSLKVGATDDQGELIPGEWQDARDRAGVDFRLAGAEGMFPGSAPLVLTVPVRNDSEEIDARLTLTLQESPDHSSSQAYLDALRFTVEQPATSLSPAPVTTGQELTLAEVSNLGLNALAAGEESTVTLTLRLVSVDEVVGAVWVDDDLQGERAVLQALFDATSE